MYRSGMVGVPYKLHEAGLTHIWDESTGTYREELIQYKIKKLSESPYYRKELGRDAERGEALIALGKMLDRGDISTLAGYWDAAISRLRAESSSNSQPMVVDSSNVSRAIYQELKRLGTSVHLPIEWQERTKKRASLQLQGQDAIDYVTFLRQFPDKEAYQAYLRTQEVTAHAS